MEYFERYIESEIDRRMQSSGVVLLAGPKYCGKTTTAKRFAKSMLQLNTQKAIDLARMAPEDTLIGEKPRLIDEWQTVPDIWNQAKNWVDEHQATGALILTGSATPADKTRLYHSGAGRITTVKMRSMSLHESRDSKGTVSLRELFDNPEARPFDMNDGYSLEETAYLLCRGGWPMNLGKSRRVALDQTENYFEGLLHFDNGENAVFRNKKPEVLRMILRSYARHVSQPAPNKAIIDDVMAQNNRTLDPKTFDEYMDVLRDLFIVEDMEAWNINRRSKAAVRATPTRHFTDASIACCALGISPSDLMNDLQTFGLLFEDMAVRDLRVYSMPLDGKVYHYRDSNGLECDAVVHLRDGRWGLVEIKLGGEHRIEEGAKNLNRLAAKVAEGRQAFRMVLTATGAAYRRKDGVLVVPINLLRG